MVRLQSLVVVVAVVAVLLATALAAPPPMTLLRRRKLRRSMMGAFVAANHLKPRCEALDTVQLPEGGEVLVLDGVELHVRGLRHKVPLSRAAGLRVDGVVQDPKLLDAVPLYEGSVEGREDDSVVTTLLDAAGHVQHCRIQIGSDVTELIAVDPEQQPGLVAEVHAEDYDESRWSGLELAGDTSEGTLSSHVVEIPAAAKEAAGQTADRREIEMVVAYSRSFCDAVGGASATNAEVVRIVAEVGAIYRRDVGYDVTLAYVDGYCTDGPYEHMATTSGCADGGYLQRFGDYWNAHGGDVPRDVAHLFHGADFEDSPTVGCASLIAVCRSTGYGVSSLGKFTGSMRTTVVAHELGHNCGALHDEGGGIMVPRVSESKEFSPTSITQMTSYLHSQQCVVNNDAPDGWSPPIETPAPPLCVDFYGDCPSFAQNGYCSYSPIRDGCPKSCHACVARGLRLWRPGHRRWSHSATRNRSAPRPHGRT